jgi:hypothetical protein
MPGYYKGRSTVCRVKQVNVIYDKYSRSGLSNREIWRRYIWPEFGICEKTFYNYLSGEFEADKKIKEEELQLSLF